MKHLVTQLNNSINKSKHNRVSIENCDISTQDVFLTYIYYIISLSRGQLDPGLIGNFNNLDSWVIDNFDNSDAGLIGNFDNLDQGLIGNFDNLDPGLIGNFDNFDSGLIGNFDNFDPGHFW